MKNILLLFLCLALVLPFFGNAQESTTSELRYDMNRVLPYLFITKETLREAAKLNDLNQDKHYRPSWVRKYLSVEVLTQQQGQIRKSVSHSDVLSPEQKKLMLAADAGTDIAINIRYIPENTLTQNEPRTIDFTFQVDPDHTAQYPGGPQKLEQFLQEKAIGKIPTERFDKAVLAAVKFTVNEEGELVDIHLFESSRDEGIDAVLLEAIRTMPCWKPAAYANGQKVKQEFAFTVGNMESCVVNLLSIRQD